MLLSLQEVAKTIEGGRHLAIAGDERLLSELPRGSWIGGTTPYFMTEDGCTATKDKLFVHDLTDVVLDSAVKSYAAGDLPKLNEDAPDSGFSIVIMPLASPAHFTYGHDAPNYPGLFMKPVVGWISGMHLSDRDTVSPKVFNGMTGEMSDQNAVAIHCPIARDKKVVVKILNLFKQGAGDTIMFEGDGFRVRECLINGKRRGFAGYLKENKIDMRLPLVADYCGTKINVSFEFVDEADGVVLCSPAFRDIEYKIAAPIGNYIDEFRKSLPKDVSPVFACNCLLNYLYSELEGQVVGTITGPITFGEVAYQLINQVLVYLEIK